MYVKIFSQILDSSIAEDPKLRHFLMDLLLLSDSEGNVIMTKASISNRIRAPLEVVEWGLAQLMKPDPQSLHTEQDGRRIIPLDGQGYGWKIINYAAYRDLKSAQQMRDETAQRVKRWREKKAQEASRRPRSQPLPGEMAAVRAMEAGDQETADKIAGGEI